MEERNQGLSPDGSLDRMKEDWRCLNPNNSRDSEFMLVMI
jgi:hypothetical protein